MTMKAVAPGALAVALAAASTFPALAAAKQDVGEPPHFLSSLTGQAGDPKNGRKLVIKQGGCLSCHGMPIPEEADHGQIGPDLAGVASRLSEGEIRLRVVDPKILNPDTMMPAFYRTDGLHRVAANWQGKPILTAQEVEDVVAYLMTLK